MSPAPCRTGWAVRRPLHTKLTMGDTDMPDASNGAMRPQDWFGVGVRLFALYPIVLAMQQLLYFVSLRLGLLSFWLVRLRQ